MLNRLPEAFLVIKSIGYDWKALSAGLYFIEPWEHRKRKHQAVGAAITDTLEATRRRKHILEGKALGIEDEVAFEEGIKWRPLHTEAEPHFEVAGDLKKPNTLRNYEAIPGFLR